MYVHDDCNGGGCDAKPTPNLTPGESFCDLEFTYCGDRIMRLVSRGPDDCKAMSDLRTMIARFTVLSFRQILMEIIFAKG
jgi:hypothetical protein